MTHAMPESDRFASLGEVAALLRAACPAGYERAWIEATVGDDWDEQTICCERRGERLQPDTGVAACFRIGRILREVRKSMHDDGNPRWSRCTFTIFPDGRHTLEMIGDE
ncbi:hypothetical protein ASG29_07220 [Sphingomonas sp. Leaf412]|nr:hypothetical protein ASG29_07220 [Sphingomonas sp. Leaf412]